jgi:predicted dinucleotide-binding enzyme
MQIGIVGAGKIGGTLATLFTQAGHQVALANSRGPETLADQVAALGPAARAVTATEAAAFGEVVVVAIPLGAYVELDPAPYAGKVVVDANNYYPSRDGHIAALDERRATSTGLLAEHLPGAHVVKAFNTIDYRNLATRGLPGAPADDRMAIPVAGDAPAAKSVLGGLIDEIGFASVDAGTLADSWRQEPGTPVYGAEVTTAEALTLLSEATR